MLLAAIIVRTDRLELVNSVHTRIATRQMRYSIVTNRVLAGDGDVT
jgi:hypothetical protein